MSAEASSSRCYCVLQRRLSRACHYFLIRDVIIEGVVSVETSRSRDVLTSRLGLGATRLGLDSVYLVSGLGPLRLVETFRADASRA